MNSFASGCVTGMSDVTRTNSVPSSGARKPAASSKAAARLDSGWSVKSWLVVSASPRNEDARTTAMTRARPQPITVRHG